VQAGNGEDGFAHVFGQQECCFPDFSGKAFGGHATRRFGGSEDNTRPLYFVRWLIFERDFFRFIPIIESSLFAEKHVVYYTSEGRYSIVAAKRIRMEWKSLDEKLDFGKIPLTSPWDMLL
jgi:hypothetical protein